MKWNTLITYKQIPINRQCNNCTRESKANDEQSDKQGQDTGEDKETQIVRKRQTQIVTHVWTTASSQCQTNEGWNLNTNKLFF